MIILGSRYQNQTVSSLQTSNGGVRHFVLRNVRPERSGNRLHLWTVSDSIYFLAQAYLGNAARWWEIMDANPELVDAMNIAPGAMVRIPSA